MVSLILDPHSITILLIPTHLLWVIPMENISKESVMCLLHMAPLCLLCQEDLATQALTMPQPQSLHMRV